MKKALLIVDVQNDFCEGGALGTDGGSAVAAAINDHIIQSDYDLVVASRDWHSAENDNGGHFSDSPDFVDTWPTHCVAWTAGAGYHPNLDYSLVDEHIYKGMGSPDYSAFQGKTSEGESLLELLDGVTELTVVGIATDYCVKESALDAVKAGIPTRVISHLTSAVAPESRREAIDAMTEAGVKVQARARRVRA